MNTLLFLTFLSVNQPAPPPTLKVERTAMYVAAVADVLTTRAAIKKGAVEGNPLLTPIIGKTPSTLKLVGAKAASLLLTELSVKYLKKKGEFGRARFLYILSTIMWGLASGMNLQFTLGK